MTNTSGTRELALKILLMVEEGANSHTALSQVLQKYQYLPKQDRSFITRLCEGTLEYQIQLDHILNQYSSVPVSKMKPVIRLLLRMGVYQLIYLDSVPDSAVVNEAVKLTQARGFYNLKAFVNGVLRSVAREKDNLPFPSREENLTAYLSIRYSMPEILVERFLAAYGEDVTEKMLSAFLEEPPTTVRVRCPGRDLKMVKAVKESLESQGVRVEEAPYLPYAFKISNYDHLMALDAFVKGQIQVQDVSSMLVAEVAAPKKGDLVIDLCAAPGGKSIHLGDMMDGFGFVDARDISQKKVSLIEENIRRAGIINVQARVQDATVFDPASECKADIVIADLPCSGYGVLAKKPDIKARVSQSAQEEIVRLQRQILSVGAEYVKSRGCLVYSTCTIAKEENEENMLWFLNNFPFRLESIDEYLPEELRQESTSLGYLQLLPGVHGTDGFFIAKFRRK